MAKVTWPYIEQSFYQHFTRMTRPEQHGILTGLRAVMLAGVCEQQESDDDEQAELFVEVSHDANGTGV